MTPSANMDVDRAELVFIPVAGMGHLISMVEIAKIMVKRDRRLSITVLIMRLRVNSELNTHLDSLSVSLSGLPIRLVTLPCDDESVSQLKSSGSPLRSFSAFIDFQKPRVRDAVATRLAEPDSGRLVGFVIDLFCTVMMDVADEFGVPTHIFFTSGAAFLGLMVHVRELNEKQGKDLTEFKDSDAELAIPSHRNPVPARVLPSVFVEKGAGGPETILKHARNFLRARGVLVNTFEELESYALASLSGVHPPAYAVGPILNMDDGRKDPKWAEIMAWLDQQPPRTVVFLCFGSMGSFGEPQVREIARGLERSGHRFLWSLRRPPPKGVMLGLPSDYGDDVNQVLPEGFLDRTAGIGRVIGWAPQAAVLSHEAIGGFVSHCGWNSTLESLWCGVPVATWPIYAEQQMNAFQMVREAGLAVELTLDYRKELREEEAGVIIGEEAIERGIGCVMEQDSEVRKRVAMMSEASRKAMAEGGSSYTSLGRFIEDAIDMSHK